MNGHPPARHYPRGAMSVWSYRSGIKPDFSFEIPGGAQFLTAKDRDGEVVMFFLVDPHEKAERRHFRIAGTEQSISLGVGLAGIEYLASLHAAFTSAHVFEVMTTARCESDAG